MYGRSFGSLAAVCLVALFLGCVNATEEASVRIVNGEVINIRQAPYMVQLRYPSGQPFCGGTLVHPQIVVTAAHCFEFIAPENGVIVVAGATTINEDGEQRRILVSSQPPVFSKQSMNADVAILKLNSPFPINELIQTRPLCSAPVPANQLVQVSGWGDLWFQGPGSHELRTINVPVMDLQQCQSKYRFNVPITNMMLCAYPNRQASCQGDSGGPAMYGDELCGIVSFSYGCAMGAPTIFTDVYALRRYIEGIVKAMISS